MAANSTSFSMTDNDRTMSTRYVIKKLLFQSGKTKINIRPDLVMGLEIREDYLENLYPIIKIDVNMSAKTYYKIKKLKNKCTVSLILRKFKTEIDEYDPDTMTSDITTDCIKSNFILIMDEQTDDMQKGVRDEHNKDDFTEVVEDPDDTFEEEIDPDTGAPVADTAIKTEYYDDDEDNSQVDNLMSFYLFQNTDSIRKNVNQVFKNCTVADAITFLLNKAELNNVLMAQPDNTKRYEAFYIPPMSITKALMFIDSYYGIYKKGTIFYKGLKHFYIMPYATANPVSANKEHEVVYIVVPKTLSSSDSGQSTQLGQFQKSIEKTSKQKKKNAKNSKTTSQSSNNIEYSKVYYVIGDYNTLDIRSESITNNYLEGSDSTEINSYTGKKTKASANAKTRSKVVTSIEENHTLNGFTASMKAAKAKAESLIIAIRTGNVDISWFTPNKTYKMWFEEESYNKKYGKSKKYYARNIVHSLDIEGTALKSYTTIELGCINPDK